MKHEATIRPISKKDHTGMLLPTNSYNYIISCSKCLKSKKWNRKDLLEAAKTLGFEDVCFVNEFIDGECAKGDENVKNRKG